jgi:hypothetical protein
MLIRIVVATALFAFAHHAEASDASNPCRGDALRLCSGEIPNRERISTCLLGGKAVLSPDCQTMFTL